MANSQSLLNSLLSLAMIVEARNTAAILFTVAYADEMLTRPNTSRAPLMIKLRRLQSTFDIAILLKINSTFCC